MHYASWEMNMELDIIRRPMALKTFTGFFFFLSSEKMIWIYLRKGKDQICFRIVSRCISLILSHKDFMHFNRQGKTKKEYTE